MKIIHNIHTNTKKEKEIILSLFRIPLNFFSDDSDEWDVEIETHSDDLTLDIPQDIEIPEESFQAKRTATIHSSHNTATAYSNNGSPITDNSLAEPLESEASPSSINSTQLSAEQPITFSPQISPTTPSHSPSSQHTSHTVSSQPTTYPHNEQNIAPTITQKNTPSEQIHNKKEQDSNNNNKDSNLQSEEQNSKEHSSNKKNIENEPNSSVEKKESSKQPILENKNTETTPKTPIEKNDANIHLPKKDNALTNARNMHKKSPTTPSNSKHKSDSALDAARDMTKKTIDGSKNIIPKKVRDNFNNAKNKTNAAITPALNAAKNANNFLNGSMQDKADALTNAATKVATGAIKAANAPMGIALESLQAADKALGNSEMGHATKRTLLGCVTCTGCFSTCAPILLLFIIPFLFVGSLSTIWGWIFGLKDNETDIETAITEETIFAETRYGENSIYSILENKLRDEKFGFQVIQEDEFGNYLYDEENQLQLIPIGNAYPGTFSDIYTLNQLSPQGQFATAYEVLISNYTVSMIKEPRHDTGMSSEHMPLFQNVLEEDFKTLRNQFYNTDGEEGQVPNSFWNKLNECLRAKYYVYNPITGEDIYVSLHDLLIETSSTDGDAEYDTTAVEAILNYTKNEQNLGLAQEFRRLQEALTRIEVMTYMMTIRNFYDQKTEFLENLAFDSISGKAAENYAYFADGVFFDQFLLIPDVESYMALSSTTATPAYAYDIAVASMYTLQESNAPRVTHNGKVYYFFETMKTWAASYTFYNSIVPKATEPIEGEEEIETSTSTETNPLEGLDEEEYSLFCTDIVPTKIEENLYKRYNITDPESFFNFFEISTGIKISTETDASTFFLVTNMLPHEVEGSFPLQAKTSITHGYKQKYSTETMQKFGISEQEHKGVDFSAKEGTPVLAIKEGTVAKVDYDPDGWGHYVIINHPDGYSSIYAHGNGNFSVGQGSSVSAGSQIMESGNSGNSTGPHLHLQVYKGSQSNHVNPISYINGTLGMVSTSSEE